MPGAKNILLLRHAKSDWHSVQKNDHDRPLSRRGERAAKTMAAHLAEHAPRPDLILCSTATRTRQTLMPVEKALGSPVPATFLEQGLYLASEEELLERLQALPEETATVLLIGHNDGLGQLACTLPGRAAQNEIPHRGPGDSAPVPGSLARPGPRDLRASGFRPAA
jgi:phosphohistidine phosphatase